MNTLQASRATIVRLGLEFVLLADGYTGQPMVLWRHVFRRVHVPRSFSASLGFI